MMQNFILLNKGGVINMNLRLEIKKINERNKRVELNKAWETIFTRKLLIFVLTYLVIVVFFIFAGLEKAFINSIVPAVAFVLSTLTIPFFKKKWLRYVQEDN